MADPRTDFVKECLEDLDNAISELTHALGDQPRQRRAVKAVVNELYRLQAYRRETESSPKSYYRHADSITPGKITEGIIFVRGILAHRITRPIAPIGGRGLYPPFYPPVYPRRELSWIGPAEMIALFADAESKGRPFSETGFAFYLSHVADQRVLDTVRIAREFLVSDPVLGQLP